jgi:hypothetical protein
MSDVLERARKIFDDYIGNENLTASLGGYLKDRLDFAAALIEAHEKIALRDQQSKAQAECIERLRKAVGVSDTSEFRFLINQKNHQRKIAAGVIEETPIHPSETIAKINKAVRRHLEPGDMGEPTNE